MACAVALAEAGVEVDLHESRPFLVHFENTEGKGFHLVSQKGSHIKYRKKAQGKVLTVIVPAGRKEIPIRTFHSILKQSNLTRSDFTEN